MSYILSARERSLMDHLQLDHKVFHIRGQLPVGAGKTTIERLNELGLLQAGTGRFGEIGWRLSEDGWRCMYGKTHDEIVQSGVPHYPLKVWSWPPTPDDVRKPTNQASRLSTMPSRLAELPSRLAELPPRLKSID